MTTLIKPVKGVTFSPDRKGFIQAVSRKESSSDLRYDYSFIGKNAEGMRVDNPKAVQILNPWKYMGLFQFSEIALEDVGCYKFDGTRDETHQDWKGSWTGLFGATSFNVFRASGSIQMKAIEKWIDILCRYARGINLNEFYGKTINGFEVTESGVVAAIHLKGMGAVKRFLTSNGVRNEGDANGTRVGDYMELFAHYDLESCCKRKIYIRLVDGDNKGIARKEVKIKSRYKGKFNVGEVSVAHKTDDGGNLPVIVRHPGAEIQLEIDGKKVETIKQLANKVQKYNVPYLGEMKYQSSLETHKGEPTPRAPSNKNPPASPPPPQSRTENTSKPSTSEEVDYGVTIVDGDSKKKITHMRFFLLHNGNLSTQRTDAKGVKSGLKAKSGDTIEILVKGEDRNQSIAKFTVTESTGIKTVQLPVVRTAVKLSIKRNGRLIPMVGYKLKAIYRGKEYVKTTNRNGMITVNTLTAFPVRLKTLQGKLLTRFRTDKTKPDRHYRIRDKEFKVVTYNPFNMKRSARFTLTALGDKVSLQTNGTGEMICRAPFGTRVLVKSRVGSVEVDITDSVNEIHLRKGHQDLTYIETVGTLAKTVPQVKLPSVPKTQPQQNTKTTESKTEEKPVAENKTPNVSVTNTRTEKGGKPVTVISKDTPPASDTTVYHIYHTGKIKRQNASATGFAEFIYYDEKGGKHNLGKSAYIPAKKLGKGNVPVGGKVYLIDQRKHAQYKKGTLGYKWTIQSSSRRYYLSGYSLAAVLGAMCSLGYNHYIGTGFSNRKGESVAPSKSHINGVNGDFRYLGKNQAHVSGAVHTTYKSFDWDANVKFVKALYKFGYKHFLSHYVKYNNNKLLPHSTKFKNHHHHLHIQGFRPDTTDI